MMYKCAQCGKEFYFSGETYAYKKSIGFKSGKPKVLNFCGWNCMRTYERKKEVERWMKK